MQFTGNSIMKKIVFAAILSCLLTLSAFAQETRMFSGVVVTPQFELVPNVEIAVETSDGILNAKTDAEGSFSVEVPRENLSVRISGRNIDPQTLNYSVADDLTNLRIRINYIVPPVAESVTITDDALTPSVENRNAAIYDETLFGRDDQLIFTLNAGINAGQHEGGGKSLEIRRYGFNTDHGGVNGGLKILVDNVQQNQGTQGHGQGYLGDLKSLSPELVESVSIINGPFSAAYGDFSGLGVVKIDLKESLPQVFTARIQGGSHRSFRGFFAYSPEIENIDAFISYEPSYTDGPFESPLKYRRDNVSGNFTYHFDDKQSAGIKFNAGRSDYFSSGQIPLDLVRAGMLGRFGVIDPDNGGEVQSGLIKGYYRREFEKGTTVKADLFVARSLFDLYSNFTFFLFDPIYGDEIQQHDSRLQEGGHIQVFQPYKLFGNFSVLNFGGSFLLNQINVGLYPTTDRNPNRKFLSENIDNPDVLFTDAQANVNNYAGYIQNDLNLFNGHLRIETGLRWDYFSFDVNGFELSDTELILNGEESAYKFQPKLGLAFSPFETFPLSFYANYGRGITSQDARGVVRNPHAPKIAVTDFYQFGTSYNSGRFSGVLTTFLIDRSHEQVYIPDDGSIEFADPSCSSGVEFRGSARITKNLSVNGGVTRVLEAYFRDTNPRIFVDSAPHTVANGSVVLSELRGFNVFLTWRHISNYRLDGEDEAIRASGHDVVDFALSKRLTKWLDFNFSVDNIFNKKYFETQNYFESRVSPNAPVIERIHVTPGYSTTVNVGLTFRFGAKD
jgi:outer membrane receptor protein involved in Fe transport